MKLRGLYLVTPDEVDTNRLLDQVEPLLATRPALIQYRNKLADGALRRTQATASRGASPSQTARQAKTVPVRPRPPSHATSTR